MSLPVTLIGSHIPVEPSENDLDIGKGLATCTTYMSQTRDQQHFTISELVADWHEPMVPQRIMCPSIARANGQLDPRCS